MATSEPTEDLLSGQILQSALQLFLQHGLKKVTIDDVAKSIGKSRTVVYYYFRNRDDLFNAVTDQLIREVLNELQLALEKGKTIDKKLKAFALAKVKSSESRKHIFRAMEAGMNVDEISKHAQTMSDLHKRLIRQEAQLLRKTFEQSVEAQEIRKLKKKELEKLIFILLSSIRGIRREMVHENDFSELEITIDYLVQMIMSWINK